LADLDFYYYTSRRRGGSSLNLVPSSTIHPLDTQVTAEFWNDLGDDGNVNFDADFDLFEDFGAAPGAGLNELDMYGSDLGDDDLNLREGVLSKPAANGYNDLDDNLNTDLDGHGHGAAVNRDLFDESDGDFDLLDDSSNDWTTIFLAIELFNINGDRLLEADADVVQVLIAMAGLLGETATALQTLDQVIGSIRQQ